MTKTTTIPVNTTVPCGTITPCGDPPQCTCPVNGWWSTTLPSPCPVHYRWPTADQVTPWPVVNPFAPACPPWNGVVTNNVSLLKPDRISDEDVERIAQRMAEILAAADDHEALASVPAVPVDPTTSARIYRCKHKVEAMKWQDTDEARESFWHFFSSHDQVFETRGSVIVLPDECGEAAEGEWVLWSDGEFLVMDAEAFAETYEVM